MRISNMMEFTEHHRYYIFRDFSLSSVDAKMLSLIYQPMVGAVAIAMYQQLYYGIPEGRTGYSALEPQRKLFLGLGLEMNEASRRSAIEGASRLEAVGLLQTSRLVLQEQAECVYEYELVAPLSPGEFFRNMHLTMLLRDKVGKYAVIALRESFGSAEPEQLGAAMPEKENISIPFYELFRLNVKSVDPELEQALAEVAPARQGTTTPETASAKLSYGELILRFPRNSANRAYVERLRHDTDALAQINYVAYKYHLSVASVCRLLDEDGVFGSDGAFNSDEMQWRANQWYRQDKKRGEDRQRNLARVQMYDGEAQDGEREEPDEQEHDVGAEHYLPIPAQLEGRCDIGQYNTLMRNEPHTRFLKRFFPGAVPDWIDNLFERIDLNYKLAAPVINVLAHYVLGANDSGRVTKAYIDAVASNMLMKRIDTFEKAVQYVREQSTVEQEKERRKTASAGSGRAGGPTYSGAKGGGRAGASRKPTIPIVSGNVSAAGMSADEMEELRRLARKLDGKS